MIMACGVADLSHRQVLKKAGRVIAGVALLAGQCACSVSLLNASASGDTKAVLSLLHKGHNVNRGFPLVGTRPLMLAAAYGHTETARVLLNAGADVNAEDLTGWTALHAGTFNGDPSTVSLLLEHGARPRTAHWFLESPLSMAERLHNEEIFELLRRTTPGAADNVPAIQNGLPIPTDSTQTSR
ncbi:MAG: ankyrin repeat domain-containing protein [Nitrospirota bacterium]